jgi:hypothetical protein
MGAIDQAEARTQNPLDRTADSDLGGGYWRDKGREAVEGSEEDFAVEGLGGALPRDPKDPRALSSDSEPTQVDSSC